MLNACSSHISHSLVQKMHVSIEPINKQTNRRASFSKIRCSRTFDQSTRCLITCALCDFSVACHPSTLLTFFSVYFSRPFRSSSCCLTPSWPRSDKFVTNLCPRFLFFSAPTVFSPLTLAHIFFLFMCLVLSDRPLAV